MPAARCSAFNVGGRHRRACRRCSRPLPTPDAANKESRLNISRRSVPESVAELRAAGISEILARVYAARGVCSTAELDLSFACLPSWTALKGIDSAAARLADAIARGERMLVVADYD